MKRFLLTICLFSLVLGTAYGQNELNSDKKNEPCTSVVVKFRNFSLRNYQLSIPDKITISAAILGTTTFHVKPGEQMTFSVDGKNYPLVQAGSDTKKVETYNLNRLIKKRKRELGL